MHVRDLIELAGWLVSGLDGDGRAIVGRDAPAPSRRSLFDYWLQSRCRLERWGHAIHAFDARLASEPGASEAAWRAARPVWEEILASEMLTRVVAALDLARRTRQGCAGPMIGPRTIAIDHADMANRVLRRLVTAQGAPADLLASLHRLRRRVEYWTDRLIGAIDCDHAPRWAAFDADRAKRFGETPWSEPASSGTDARLREIRDALRGAFASVLSEPTAHGPSNGRVAAAVVSAWGRGPGSGPPPQAVWIEHLFTQTADAAEWVHDALACGNGPALEGPVRCRFDGRSRLRGRHVR